MNFTKTFLLTVICFLLIYLVTPGCKKDNGTNVQGYVVNDGSPDADGCGWNIIINNVDYHPDNLSATFETTDSLRVNLSYTLTGEKYQCGMDPNNKMPVIHINKISKD